MSRSKSSAAAKSSAAVATASAAAATFLSAAIAAVAFTEISFSEVARRSPSKKHIRQRETRSSSSTMHGNCSTSEASSSDSDENNILDDVRTYLGAGNALEELSRVGEDADKRENSDFLTQERLLTGVPPEDEWLSVDGVDLSVSSSLWEISETVSGSPRKKILAPNAGRSDCPLCVAE